MSERVKVNGEEFNLDPERLKFNEANLSQYMQSEAAWYNYTSQKLADVEREVQQRDLEYDVKRAEKFRAFKEKGGSDKLADANADADVEVVAAKELLFDAKHAARSILLYLRAFDKSHENATNFGHMLRKEMDKLLVDIKGTSDYDMEKKIDEIIGV